MNPVQGYGSGWLVRSLLGGIGNVGPDARPSFEWLVGPHGRGVRNVDPGAWALIWVVCAVPARGISNIDPGAGKLKAGRNRAATGSRARRKATTFLAGSPRARLARALLRF